MKTVRELSALAGVSVRTLQYYDRIGLLPPSERTEAGYRLYDDAALTRLQQIMVYRELEFPLAEIKRILNAPDYDRNRALAQQIELLALKREHLDNLIAYARGLYLMGERAVDFSAFDTKRFDEYAAQAKAQWGKSEVYREFKEKKKAWPPDAERTIESELMALFADFGALRGGDPAAPEAQAQVKALQEYITAHFYTCTDKILAGLGRLYAGGGAFTENIDAAGGEGTAAFAAEAIRLYCGK